MKICKVNKCGRPVASMGFCGKHYQRNHIYGNPVEPYHWKDKKKFGKIFQCEICSKEFYRSPSDIKRKSNRFCSRKCSALNSRGKKKYVVPLEGRAWLVDRKGYLVTYLRGKRIRQHRWIVETKVLKRALRADEIIHHLNGIKTDNRIENLVVCCNKTHQEFIKILRRRIYELEEMIRSDLIKTGLKTCATS